MPTYTFKIDLINTEPLVSRTIKVCSETTLYLMHHIIQTVMGWENRHLYEFTINTLHFANCRLVEEDFGDITDVKTVPKIYPNKLNRIKIEKELGILGAKLKDTKMGSNKLSFH